ncbi:hypothetical protein HD806DRAFT_543375 [Xylariaceae sp. AK1471]|nr:hypothetical protein HD806DRAFT_543375 [Xylariaceae sp. AK1471]
MNQNVEIYNRMAEDGRSSKGLYIERIGRRIFAIGEASLALRAAIQEEERAVLAALDSERWTTVQADTASTRCTTTLYLEMLIREARDNPMFPETACRALISAQLEYECNFVAYACFNRYLVVFKAGFREPQSDLEIN